MYIYRERAGTDAVLQVGVYAILYAGTVPSMPNISHILTNVEHRFGHQSGLGESSGRISTTCLYGIAFRVYLMFFQNGNNINY